MGVWPQFERVAEPGVHPSKDYVDRLQLSK